MTDWSRWVCEQNIERFRALLAAPHDEREEKILTELLSREEDTLARLPSDGGLLNDAEPNPSRAANPSSGPPPVRNDGADASGNYRCYFVGELGDTCLGTPRSFEPVESLCAATDAEAESITETLIHPATQSQPSIRAMGG